MNGKISRQPISIRGRFHVDFVYSIECYYATSIFRATKIHACIFIHPDWSEIVKAFSEEGGVGKQDWFGRCVSTQMKGKAF